MTLRNLYDGDPRVVLTDGGADIVYQAGQPVMDRGLENAVILSLFTSSGWAGNRLLTGPHEAVGSEYTRTLSAPITRGFLERCEAAAHRALAWMVPARVAESIEVVASNPAGLQLHVTVTVRPPGRGDPVALLLTKNGPNWIAQKNDPAHRRV